MKCFNFLALSRIRFISIQPVLLALCSVTNVRFFLAHSLWRFDLTHSPHLEKSLREIPQSFAKHLRDIEIKSCIEMKLFPSAIISCSVLCGKAGCFQIN